MAKLMTTIEFIAVELTRPEDSLSLSIVNSQQPTTVFHSNKIPPIVTLRARRAEITKLIGKTAAESVLVVNDDDRARALECVGESLSKLVKEVFYNAYY